MRVRANTIPALAISSAPTMSMRRRPLRSARVLNQSETAVSPISVSVNSTPICCVPIPSPVRYKTSTTDKAPYANNRMKRVSNSSRPSGGSVQSVLPLMARGGG